MKKQILIILIATLCFTFSSYQIQEERVVINVEIPVRVFEGNTFVDNLTIEDFEVYEDGKLQKAEAIYLIKKRSIERSEERKRFAPETSRHFYLWFEITEYMPRISEAIEYFFENVFFPGDNLVIITPLKAYHLKSQALEIGSGEVITNQLTGILRRDATAGNAEYRAALRDLRDIIRIIEAEVTEDDEKQHMTQEIEDSAPNFFAGGSLEEVVQMYSTIATKLENLRNLDKQKFLDFAKILKDKEGQKHIFLFYEREFMPQLQPNTLMKFMSQFQDKPALQHNLSSLFETYTRDVSMDAEKVKQAFADSSLSIHFLFLKNMAESRPGIQLQERSEDIYRLFKQMAQATGGLSESSSNPAFAFKRAVEAFENYYLLYYTPKNYTSDGKFKKIEVRVKNKKFTVTHRAGYFAN
jgi:hypothetical protein